MAALGLSLQTVGMTMQTALVEHRRAFRAGEYEYDINIKYNAFDRKSIADVSNLIFINDMGQQIEVKSICNGN
jgi:HAE1 family hydrophobic/amphiphilic exporter-1